MLTNKDKIFVEERRECIMKLLQKYRRITLVELSKAFDVGEVTLRRDLNELEAKGLIRRTHGGAILVDNASEEIAIKERESKNKEEKERIARFISQIVRNGETLMMDGGSTTLHIAQMLKNKNELAIITNTPVIANELVGINGNRVILTGGVLQAKTHALVGPVAKYALSGLHADKVILGMTAMLPEEGFFTVNHYEAEIKRTMMRCGKEVIVAIDSSKIGNITFSFVSDFSRVDKLVIDSGISKEQIETIERQDVEVIVV